MVYAVLVTALVLVYVLAWSLVVTRLAWRAWRATGQFLPHTLLAAAVTAALVLALSWVVQRFGALVSGAT